MQISSATAAIEYDCANGTINGPLKTDRSGRFAWHGFHRPEHGGPVRSDEGSNGHAAVYSGSIDGDRMTLRVKLPGTNEDIGTYVLTKGSDGRVFKCR